MLRALWAVVPTGGDRLPALFVMAYGIQSQVALSLQLPFAAIQLGRLRKLLADRKIELEFDSKAMQWLANRGSDPVYGV